MKMNGLLHTNGPKTGTCEVETWKLAEMNEQERKRIEMDEWKCMEKMEDTE